MNLNDLVSEAELARLLRTHRLTLARNRRDGRGPKYLRLGKHIRYRLSDVQHWLERHATDPEMNADRENAQ